MNNEEVNISELCRFIRDTVGDAVNKAAVSNEVQEIKSTVKSVVDEIKTEINTQVRSVGDTVKRGIPPPPPPPPHVYQTHGTPPPAPPRQAYTPHQTSGPPMWKGSTQGMMIRGNMMMFFGIMGSIAAAGFVLLGTAALIATAMEIQIMLAWGIFSLLPVGAVLAFIMLARRGINTYGMAARYKKYIETIGKDSFCLVSRLADVVGKKEKFVAKDLKRMIKAGMFPEGNLDRDNSTLMLDDETYQYYLSVRKVTEVKQAEPPPPPPAAAAAPKTEVEQTLDEGKEYIRRMRLANDLIEGEEMSEKIDRIEKIGMRIFEHVEQHPAKLPDIRRFMSYYLPITIKLVEGYAKFDNQPVQGDNITATKREIEDTLDTITKAFENLLDSMFQMEAMDISSDISTLSAMFAQEGLTDSDFNLK